MNTPQEEYAAYNFKNLSELESGLIMGAFVTYYEHASLIEGAKIIQKMIAIISFAWTVYSIADQFLQSS